MMMARTTVIGLLLALTYLLWPSYWFNKKIVANKARFFWGLIILPLTAFLFISLVSPKTKDALESAAAFGFEMFINYSESGEFESASTNALQEGFIFPTKAKTYIIGDGKYYETPGNPSNGYYMGTDVGYLRLTYYFGLTGMVCYFLFQFFAIQNIAAVNRKQKELKWLVIFTIVFLLLLNIKGFTDLFFLSILFSYPFSETAEIEG
jgi:hypothetical protein